jgi:hypothetical protein
MTTTAVHSDSPTVAHEGLAAELLARRRKKLSALTAALVLAVAIALGLVGGVEAQKHWGASTTAAATGRPGGFAGFAGRGGAAAGGAGVGGFAGFGGAAAGGAGVGGFAGFGGAAGGGSATNGTVTLIKGATLYVTDATGNTVLVHTTAKSTVKKSVTATTKTIHPGDSVSVTGTQNKDGSYSAQAITIGGTNG